MKQYFLFLLLGLAMLACNSDYDNTTRHPIEHNHDYHSEKAHNDSEHDHADGNHQHKEELLPEIEINESDLYGGADRRLWQRPDFIVRRLGDLDGKVVADIGAGPYGYFTFRIVSKIEKVKKVIATDIDPKAVNYIDSIKTIMLPMDLQKKVEARLVETNDSKLGIGEADVILMVNTYAYIENRIDYLEDLKDNLSGGGKVYVIDFKKRSLPIGPTTEEKVALFQVELDLAKAGFEFIQSDDKSLDYQYIVVATKGEEKNL